MNPKLIPYILSGILLLGVAGYIGYLKYTASSAQERVALLEEVYEGVSIAYNRLLNQVTATREALFNDATRTAEIENETKEIDQNASQLQDDIPSPALRAYIDGMRKSYENRNGIK